MRLFCLAIATAVVSIAEPSRACGVELSPFGSTGATSEPRPVFVSVGGGIATKRASDVDTRTTTPFFVAGIGGDVYSAHGVHFAPMVDVMMTSRASVVSTTDVAVALRLASDGFAHGGFGAALDGGVWTRAYGGRAIGSLAQLTLGAPYGLQASWLAQNGSGYAFVVGIDIARMQ